LLNHKNPESALSARSKKENTHKVKTNEKRKENMRPEISAVGLMDATARAMVVK